MPDGENNEAITRPEFDQLKKMVKDIHHRLLGNGSPGLVRQVDRLQTFVDGRRWFERAMIAGGIGVGMTTFATLLVVLIKLL